jgi:vacuolar-type H+-ATPase subunit I/STV1
MADRDVIDELVRRVGSLEQLLAQQPTRPPDLAAVEEALAEVLRRLETSEEQSSPPQLVEALRKLDRRLSRLALPDLAQLEALVVALGDHLEARLDDLTQRVASLTALIAPEISPQEGRRR